MHDRQVMGSTKREFNYVVYQSPENANLFFVPQNIQYTKGLPNPNSKK